MHIVHSTIRLGCAVSRLTGSVLPAFAYDAGLLRKMVVQPAPPCAATSHTRLVAGALNSGRGEFVGLSVRSDGFTSRRAAAGIGGAAAPPVLKDASCRAVPVRDGNGTRDDGGGDAGAVGVDEDGRGGGQDGTGGVQSSRDNGPGVTGAPSSCCPLMISLFIVASCRLQGACLRTWRLRCRGCTSRCFPAVP